MTLKFCWNKAPGIIESHIPLSESMFAAMTSPKKDEMHPTYMHALRPLPPPRTIAKPDPFESEVRPTSAEPTNDRAERADVIDPRHSESHPKASRRDCMCGIVNENEVTMSKRDSDP
mmetsp:Transcript_29704/g.60685  ORF Transcript_29704/g.60685 Transcript_29704/m.60685 type:complete len:117 (-) Transcript_29704:231-581(-)